MTYSSCSCSLTLDLIKSEEQLDNLLITIAKQARKEIEAIDLHGSCNDYLAAHDDPIQQNDKHPFGSITSSWDILYDTYVLTDQEEFDITQTINIFKECISKVESDENGIRVFIENETFDNGDCKEAVFAVASILAQYSSSNHFKVFSDSFDEQGSYPHFWIGYRTSTGITIEHGIECLERLIADAVTTHDSSPCSPTR